MNIEPQKYLVESSPAMEPESPLIVAINETTFDYRSISLKIKILRTPHILAAAVPGEINIFYENPRLDMGRFVNASYVNGAPKPFQTTYGIVQHNLQNNQILFSSFVYQQEEQSENEVITAKLITSYLSSCAPSSYIPEIEEIVTRVWPLLTQLAKPEQYYCGHDLILIAEAAVPYLEEWLARQ